MQSNDLNKTEGIVLQATNYREHDKILTIFTPSNGLLKLFVKGNKKNPLQPYTNLLARAEFLYVDGRGLSKLQEGFLLNSHYELRNTLESLETALKMAGALLKSQIGGHKIYLLYAFFLEHISEAKFPETVYTAFLLKLLKAEGILQKEGCSHCDNEQASYRFGGESFCEAHALNGSKKFLKEEERLLFFLRECKSFSEMATMPLEREFIAKIASLFDQALL